uniref:Uncharacterized protein n=1 Tax=Oryza rufipogon TaxID=4529 RepID=A0A0E0R9R8_ORYRU
MTIKLSARIEVDPYDALTEKYLTMEILSLVTKHQELMYGAAGSSRVGHQLDTLYPNNPSMYDGNGGLCGPPLQRNCSAPKLGSQNKSVNDSEPTMLFCFGIVTGFLIGLWVVFCAVMFIRSWRVAYFRQFDKFYDKTYVFAVVTWARLKRQATAN